MIQAQPIAEWLGRWPAVAYVQFNQYDEQRYSRLVQSVRVPLPDRPDVPTNYEALGATWRISYQWQTLPARPDVRQLVLDCRVVKGEAKQASVSLIVELNNWKTSNYVLMPAAAYNGNRFESRAVNYSPKLPYFANNYRNAADSLNDIPQDIGKKVPTIISDVPRLNIASGPSRMQLRSGDMSTPSVGFFASHLQQAYWLLTEQATPLGDTGVDLEESKDRSRAWVSFTVPVVRETHYYTITTTQSPSPDRGHDFAEGMAFTLRTWLHQQSANDLQALYESFKTLRKLPFGPTEYVPSLPFSEAAKLMAEQMNREGWDEPQGFYSVGSWRRWTPGWVGGFQIGYAMLLNLPNDSLTYRRVLRELNFALTTGISPSGLFWEAYLNGLPNAGDYRRAHTRRWHLVRKSADGLYYALLMLQHLDRTRPGWEKQLPDAQRCKQNLRGVADVFVRNWQKDKQLGQFVDSYTGEIIVGGSASGAIVPAALLLAADYFQAPDYKAVAAEIMDYYDREFIQKGYSTGGPGDALQNPDSESAYSLVESAVALYEATREARWLDVAERATAQFATWVMSYNYRFPENSTFAQLGIRSTGAVWANTQNKHGSPNICTHGGLALLKLYQITGNLFYAELLKDIVFYSVQYISRPGHLLGKVPVGGVNERCSTTDWLEGIGEVFGETTWAQIANMLSVGQIPGLYIASDGKWLMLDHLEARLVSDRKREWVFEISNPNPSEARLKVLAQTVPHQLDRPEQFRTEQIPAKSEKIIIVPKK